MYKIYIDDILIYNSIYENMVLDNPELELELNQAGELKFNIYPNHPYYDKFSNVKDPKRFKKMKSIVKVYRDEELLFRGRILENEDGFYKEKQVVCEGELAFFIDSQIRPYSFTGTPEEILGEYIRVHNEQMADFPEKQFVLGTVTVTDGEVNDENTETRSSESVVSVWNEISGLLESLGGYLIFDTDEDGKRRINWLTEDDFYFGTQNINFGENILNLKINVKGDEIITALIPIGGKTVSSGSTEDETTTETRLTIESIEDGIVAETEDDIIYKKDDYIYSEKAVEEYGLIFGANTWDDVTEDVLHLLKVGIEHLNEYKKAIESIELNIFDLSKIRNVSAFKLGTKVKVTSKIHGLNGESFPITKMSLKFVNPSSDTLTLVKSERSFTETSASMNKTQTEVKGVIERVEKVENNTSGMEGQIEHINQSIVELSSSITQTSEKILTTVSEEYYTKEEAKKLVESVSTEFEQTNSSFEMRFNQVSSDIEGIINDANDHYQEQVKYIRFEDGIIYIGEQGNELILKQQNDRISFLENGVEVAYFSNRKLYVLDGEFINSLKIGNFSFIPRSNGNLSFKKIV